MTLDDLAMDALTEIFNLGVGQAAHAFSQIAGDTVLLTVPRIRMVTPAELTPELTGGDGSAVSAVRQRYSGAIHSEAILMFPAEQSLQLVQMMVGGELPLDQLAEMEQEALSEIGNILLNSVMASVADALQIHLDGSLPTVQTSEVGHIIRPDSDLKGAVLLIDIQFEVASREVKGLLAFLLDVASEEALEGLMARFLSGV
ncbi:chemotaxis protein CheC [Hydrogenophaga soli]|nr:chemotaxis protein CheC [Burkholderiaceae bacterium]